MGDDSLTKRLSYEYPFFESYLEPNGALTLDPACHACFYYGMLAAKAIQLQGTGINSQIIEYKVGDAPPPWFEANLANIARGVALMYALENPDAFLQYKKEAWIQAMFLGVEIPEIVFRVSPGIIVH
ncbi:MAG: hypothetical protein ACRCZI_09825 [Cetobacterium sp.]